MSTLVECKDISKNYGKMTALRNVDLNLETGKIIGLLGPNGSGKTTLIKILAGLLKNEQGKVLIDGKPVGIETKKIVSFLSERPYLDPAMKVKEAIVFFSDFYEDFDVDAAEEMLDRLQIPLNVKLKTLSKGNKEKVQLILVMSRRAKLYLLDEPIGGVDPAARDYILKTILTNYQEESSVLISTHLISDVEQILDDIIFLKNGEIVLHKSADAIREENEKSVDKLFREVFACS